MNTTDLSTDLNQYFKGAYGTMYTVTDMQKSVKYYREVLNFTVESESPDWTTLMSHDHRVCLHSMNEASGFNPPSTLVLNVVQLETLVSELKKRGVEFSKDIHQVCEGGYSADFIDPNGQCLSLFEYKG